MNVSGSPDDKQFLLEEMGGGVALFDYDNDGWLDIFLVNGTQPRPEVRDRKPTSYLFHNNRDGTFTDVTAEGRPHPLRLGPGLLRRRLRQRRLRRSLRHATGAATSSTATTATAPSPTSPRGPGVAGRRSRWGAGCCFLDYDRDGHLDLFVASYVNFDPAAAPRPGAIRLLPLQRDPGALRSAGLRRRHQHPLSQPRRRHLRRRLGGVRHRAARAALPPWCSSAATGGRPAPTGWARRRRISTTTAGPTSTSPATPRRACSTATTTTARSARSRSRPAARSTRTASPWPAWASAWATTTPTAGSTSSARTSPSR